MAQSQKKYVTLSKLQTFLNNLTSKFSEISHKHTISDITDFDTDSLIGVDTELSSTSNNPVANNVLNAEFDAISNAMGALELAVDGKASYEHNHDDLYCTQIELDSALSQKSQVQIVIWGVDD